jgi:hypothetical protein
VDAAPVQAFIRATRETLGRPQAESGPPKTLLGAIEAQMAGQKDAVVGVVELADGRPKRSRETIQ